jgi:hypothetical protein
MRSYLIRYIPVIWVSNCRIYVKPEFYFQELMLEKFEYFDKSLVGIAQLMRLCKIISGARRD